MLNKPFPCGIRLTWSYSTKFGLLIFFLLEFLYLFWRMNLAYNFYFLSCPNHVFVLSYVDINRISWMESSKICKFSVTSHLNI